MYNFCQSPFISAAEASLVHQDGYDVTNLFSLQLEKRRNGFKVERFVRPPLVVHVTFNLSIDVHYFILWIDLREPNEKCKVDLFVSDKVSPDLIPASQDQRNFCGCFVVSSNNGTPSVFRATNAVARHGGSSSSTVQLVPATLSRAVAGSQMCEILVCQQFTSRPLKPIRQLTATTNLSICIGQYFGATRALSIKVLEVWGLPSACCSSEDLKRFEKAKEECAIQLQKNSTVVTKMYNASDYLKSDSKNNNTSTTDGKGLLSSDCDKPCEYVDDKNSALQTKIMHAFPNEKFLDQLTFNMMVLPYKMPSGYYLDQSSVEKCRETDLLYGRPPSDPFTGVPYTKTSCPQFCAQMKSEIDLYISESKRDCSRSGTCQIGMQTVGNAQQISQYRRLAYNKRKLGEWAEIPMVNSQKPCMGSSNTEKVNYDKEPDMQLTTSTSTSKLNAQRRKQEHEHEKTLQNTLNDALKNLFP